MNPRKKKVETISHHKKRVWITVSKFIRLRDKGICFVCGKYAEGSAYHAGHFIPGSICGVSLFFSEVNLHGECYNCNINLGGNGALYALAMQKKYGPDIIEKLNKERLANKGKQWNHKMLDELLTHYIQKLHDLRIS